MVRSDLGGHLGGGLGGRLRGCHLWLWKELMLSSHLSRHLWRHPLETLRVMGRSARVLIILRTHITAGTRHHYIKEQGFFNYSDPGLKH